jgi:hypothetical protein
MLQSNNLVENIQTKTWRSLAGVADFSIWISVSPRFQHDCHKATDFEEDSKLEYSSGFASGMGGLKRDGLQTWKATRRFKLNMGYKNKKKKKKAH